MQLFAFGINHQTAPLEVRERVAFNADGVPVALRDLVGHEPVREAAIILIGIFPSSLIPFGPVCGLRPP